MTGFKDAFTDETDYGNQKQEMEFKSFNHESTDDYTISLPNGGRDRIESEMPLIVALARENRIELDCEEGNSAQRINEIFDEGLCDVAELALRTADFSCESVKLYKLRGLMIGCTRDLGSFAELSKYLSKYSSAELEQFGLKAAYEQSTYRKAAKKLKETGQYNSFRDASAIAAYALFWNGVTIPDAVKDKYELSYAMGPAAEEFDPEVRNLELYELVDDLLEIIVAKLDFERASNKSQELRSLPGIFAHTAIEGGSIETYEQAAQHIFDLDTVFRGSTIRHHIKEMELWDITEMFDEIYQALLTYVLESGVVTEPVTIAYDLTDIEAFDQNMFNKDFITADGRWQFASLSLVDTDLEFAFGLKLLESEDQRNDMLKNLLRDLTSLVDVELFFADRGFDGAADIEACRAFVPDSWAISAQDNSEQDHSSKDFARLRSKLNPGETAVVRNAGFKNLQPATNLLGYSGAKADAETLDPLRGFWSDLPIPHDDDAATQLITDLNFQYNQRAKVENQFMLTKNQFDVGTDSARPPHKLFYFHMSTLFYNIYKIVDTVPSPKSGVEFDITPREVLEIIRILSFGGLHSPDLQQYLHETS